MKKKLIGLVAGGAVVAVVAAGGFAFANGQSSTSGRYRTYTAQNGSVAQALSLTGTIDSATRRDVTFSTDGTVSSVDVALGEDVEAGQQLATLDDDELAQAVSDAREAIADARQQLAADLEKQSEADSSASSSSTSASTASTSTSGSSTSATTTTQTVSSSTETSTAATAAVYRVSTAVEVKTAASATASDLDSAQANYTAARTAVTTAQSNLMDKYDEITGESVTSDEDVADATGSEGACAAFLAVTDPADQQAATFLANCQQAILTAQGSLDRVQALQAELTDLAATLDAKVTALDTAATALAEAAAAAGGSTDGGNSDSGSTDGGSSDGGKTGSGTNDGGSGGKPSGSTDGTGAPDGTGTPDATGAPDGTGTGQNPGSGDIPSDGTQSGSGGVPSGSGGSNGMGSGGGASAESTTISAARILADRAEITVAKAQLARAKQARKAGVLTAPISGTVASVGLSEGQDVSAGDASSAITILGGDGYVISATASLSDAQLLEVGQTFSGTLTGGDETVTGTVASIGVTNASSSRTPSYNVELIVDSVTSGLAEGASIVVSVGIADQTDVLTVPTSAVKRTGTQASVLVYDGEATATREVETGAVGSELTEITSGLEEGDLVVLADLSKAVTSDSDTESSGGLSGLGGSNSSSDQRFTPPSGGGFPGGGMPMPGGGN